MNKNKHLLLTIIVKQENIYSFFIISQQNKFFFIKRLKEQV